MKKIIFLTIFTFLYLVSGHTASVSAATCPLRTEAPYRSWSRNSVFYITADCRRQPIRNPEVYFTYFESWNNVLFTSDELLYSVPRHPLGFLPWGPRKDYGNGSLIKTVTDDTVYIVSAGRLYPIGSEEVFHHLHLDWSWVEDVAPSVLNLFPMRTPLVSNSDYPEQFAFQYTASTTVYTLELSDTKTVTKQKVPSFDMLQSFYRTDRVAIFPPEQTYPDAGSSAAALPVRPKPPVSLRLVTQNSRTVTIAWRDRSSNETEFRVERQDSTTQTDLHEYRVLPQNVEEFVDDNVQMGHTYIYRVRAVNAGGTSYATDLIQATIR